MVSLGLNLSCSQVFTLNVNLEPRKLVETLVEFQFLEYISYHSDFFIRAFVRKKRFVYFIYFSFSLKIF